MGSHLQQHTDLVSGYNPIMGIALADGVDRESRGASTLHHIHGLTLISSKESPLEGVQSSSDGSSSRSSISRSSTATSTMYSQSSLSSMGSTSSALMDSQLQTEERDGFFITTNVERPESSEQETGDSAFFSTTVERLHTPDSSEGASNVRYTQPRTDEGDGPGVLSTNAERPPSSESASEAASNAHVALLPTFSQPSTPPSEIRMLSQASLVSQGSVLAFLPSLSSAGAFLAEDCWSTAVDHACVATVKDVDAASMAAASAGDHFFAGSSHNDTVVVLNCINNSSCNDAVTVRNCTNNGCEGENFKLAVCAKFGCGVGTVKAIAVAGERIFTAHQDQKIRAWALRLPSSLKTQNSDEDRNGVLNAKLLGSIPTAMDSLMAFISPKNYVQVRRHHKRPWIEHVDAISCLAVSEKAGLLYSASWDRSIKTWRLSDFKCVESITRAHDDAINALVVSADGRLVYTGSGDAKVKVWHNVALSRMKEGPSRKAKHLLVGTLEAHKSGINALALSPQGDFLYSGASDKAIIVWENTSGIVKGEDDSFSMSASGALRGHRHAILCLAASCSTSSVPHHPSPKSGNQHSPTSANRHCPNLDIHSFILCSGSADKTIRVWRRQPSSRFHSCIALLRGHTAPVKCISISMSEINNSGICTPDINSSSDAKDDHHYHQKERYLIYSGSLDHDIKAWRVSIITSFKNR